MCRSSGTAAAQATFFVILAAGCGVFFVFSFAANSCRTLLAIASASTSYAVAASLRTEVGLPREDASRRLASTISRESVPHPHDEERHSAFSRCLHRRASAGCHAAAPTSRRGSRP